MKKDLPMKFMRVRLFIHAFITDLTYLLDSDMARRDKLRFLATSFRLSLKSWLFKPPAGSTVNEEVLGLRVDGFGRAAIRFLFREIFIHGNYWFTASREDSLIIDCGGNIGMATLFFKWLYPKAEVHTFEPDKRTFEVLVRNIKSNSLHNVYPHRLAVSDRNGCIDFFSDESSPGSPEMSTVRERMPKDRTTVECVSLSSFMDNDLKGRTVDFLKLDIEGAEGAVLRDLVSSGAIARVREMVIEYHHHIGKEGPGFGPFLAMLEKAGFDYQLSTGNVTLTVRGKFQDVLVYCYRLME